MIASTPTPGRIELIVSVLLCAASGCLGADNIPVSGRPPGDASDPTYVEDGRVREAGADADADADEPDKPDNVAPGPGATQDGASAELPTDGAAGADSSVGADATATQHADADAATEDAGAPDATATPDTDAATSDAGAPDAGQAADTDAATSDAGAPDAGQAADADAATEHGEDAGQDPAPEDGPDAEAAPEHDAAVPDTSAPCEGCLIDGRCVPEGEADPTDDCRYCDPDSDVAAWTETGEAPCGDDDLLSPVLIWWVSRP